MGADQGRDLVGQLDRGVGGAPWWAVWAHSSRSITVRITRGQRDLRHAV
ncbi:hypothetical protein [Mycolicibacterium lacusdiani]|nr:hypothetical protein [Mycolicibacterium lacusdiani]